MDDVGVATILNLVCTGQRVHLDFDYTNYRGEKSKRHVILDRMEFTTTEYHGKCLHMFAYDKDKQAERAFAVKDMDMRSLVVTVNE